MFAFVFEAELFVFAYVSPAFVPLFALPPKSTALRGNSLFYYSK